MHIGSIRYRLLASALLAFSLAGCDPSQPLVARQGDKPQATAPALPAPQTSQEVAPVPPPSTREQQRVNLLIQQVEQAYAFGEADYRKGQLAEAKVEFDRAVDLMLSSGIDIKGDSRLQEEFDRIVDGVNGMEMDALKQGNGFVPKVEPSPAEVASDVTIVVDPNLVAKARTDLATTKSDLPLVVNDYVASYISFFANTQKGHNTLLHSFQRAGRYKAMIQRVMAEEGVPQDLIYLAVAESGFQPRAMNARSHAGGMWQFMPYGDYGLVRNAYVDERFDPEKSTRAYARYMKFIYDQLGDWYLSMAGYDWGAGNVQRAVQKTGYADFWELYKRNNLPAETKNYVPEILAAIIIANHPSQYGFDGADRHGDHQLLRGSAAGRGHFGSADGRDDGVESQCASHGNASGRVVRSAPARWHGYPVFSAHSTDSRGQAERVALPSHCGGGHSGVRGAGVPRSRSGAGRCQSTARGR
jgi:membrane-bound lytic murein transglycosylase D